MAQSFGMKKCYNNKIHNTYSKYVMKFIKNEEVCNTSMYDFLDCKLNIVPKKNNFSSELKSST